MWWSSVLGENEELAGDLAGRESTGRQAQHLDFSTISI
jgi:hypothetical protein